jgi:hypothetical protein
LDATTVLTFVLVAIMVISIPYTFGKVLRQAGRPSLKPLAPEAQDRYGTAWDRIESHFVDAPEEAVREADALAWALLGERRHPLADNRLPSEMKRARQAVAGREGKGTEGLRKAMLHYRAVIEEMAALPQDRERVRGRQEIAS